MIKDMISIYCTLSCVHLGLGQTQLICCILDLLPDPFERVENDKNKNKRKKRPKFE